MPLHGALPDSLETPRILRIAAWMWVGYLAALLAVDALIYPRLPRLPASLYYGGNGLAALSFLGLAYWEGVRKRLGEAFLPLMILLISGAPILLHHTVVPRFPPGPLSNFEGMILRQMPVLFIGLILTAWRYELQHTLSFCVVTAALEMGLLLVLGRAQSNTLINFFFVILVRTVSFVVIGVFVSRLISRLRAQGESLRQANAQLSHYASTLENLTVSRERNRLARELHDTLAHSLTALTVSLETAKAYFDLDPEKARTLLETSLESARAGAEETRRALRALRSSDLEDLGLRLALQKLAESAAARSRLDLELALQNPLPSLSPDVEQTVYRIAQEAIENVARHARAKKLTLRLFHNGRTNLIVEDDGAGFDVHSAKASGRFGLVGMRERAELAGGSLHIESDPKKGTKITLEL